MTRHILILSIVGMVLVSLVNARYIPEEELRSKRQTGDIKTAEYQAWLALGGIVPPGCVEVACGVVDVHASVKRTSSDQRIAELKALLAMSRVVGHGQIDVDAIGKKKRSDISSDDIRRSILAQKLIQFAAERLAKTE
ncbi:uncharacterized protein LOC106873782 [Octopus bimaculoides]|uniref:uncharacterized protein LOC106873782 n=1 Tax=Octopus bimaculoides TaxID=37653 RepID=UPI00071D38A6|nr:uncharacterized protein LOC106873782 [Octopus bimaculoides]|eukprot:XP_014776777.1 PREDICTED: uncharacterized protein LOC106873782 [Octopus bimaculoides]